MKKILLLFILCFLFSCYGEKKEENIKNTDIKIDTVLNFSNDENKLIELYEKNKDVSNNIVNGKIDVDNEGKKYFLDGLDICKKISIFDFSKDIDKMAFLKEVGIFELYSKLNSGKIPSYEECLFDGSFKKECNYQESDLLLVSYFSGKVNLSNTKKYLSELVEKYKDKELSNSILLGVINEKISGKKIEFNYCKEVFLLGYKGFFDEKN